MLVVLITGSRKLPESRRGEVVSAMEGAGLVIEGGCPTGADRFAREGPRQAALITMTAQWDTLGLGAGPERNEHMAKVARSLACCGHEVVCHAWPLPGGKGTPGMVRLCATWGVKCVEH